MPGVTLRNLLTTVAWICMILMMRSAGVNSLATDIIGNDTYVCCGEDIHLTCPPNYTVVSPVLPVYKEGQSCTYEDSDCVLKTGDLGAMTKPQWVECVWKYQECTITKNTRCNVFNFEKCSQQPLRYYYVQTQCIHNSTIFSLCTTTEAISSPEGYIITKGYPAPLRDNVVCHVDLNFTNIVNITFNMVDMEFSGDKLKQNLTIIDLLSNTIVGEYHRDNSPVISVISSTVRITLANYGNKHHRGCQLTYTVQNISGCTDNCYPGIYLTTPLNSNAMPTTGAASAVRSLLFSPCLFLILLKVMWIFIWNIGGL